jgi:glutamate--cysteine ligase catalytic subunit
MLEATPGKPWGIGFKDLLDVEPNMKWRWVGMLKLLGTN